MDFTVIDPRFERLIDHSRERLVIADTCVFTEGPVWFADLQVLLWSDIPESKIHRWTPDGQTGVFRAESHNTNGNTRDRQGRLLSCEHSSRRVTRTEYDGTITVVADQFEGKKLNSPNDVVVKSDGSIWFTDPAYGTPKDEARELTHESVYRLDPATGALTAVVSDFQKPNGLAFSPDERWLYIADSSISHDPNGNSHLRRFAVNADGTLAGGQVFATTEGIPDGLRLDTEGNIWTSAGDKIDVYTPGGTLLGQVTGFASAVTNLSFGGPDGDLIFVTAGNTVTAVPVKARGVQSP